MRIDLRPVPLTQSAVRYPIRGGELISASVLIDRPKDVLRTFRDHHARHVTGESAELFHATVSLSPNQRLTQKKWKRALSFILDRLGAPFHQLYHIAFRHLNKKIDHVHVMFSPFSIGGRRLFPKFPSDPYSLQNEAARRVGLPVPFPDGPDAPVQLQAPVSRGAWQKEDPNSLAIRKIGPVVNNILKNHRPVSWGAFCDKCSKEGIDVEKRYHPGSPVGVVYRTDIMDETRLSRMTRTCRVKGRDVGRQFGFLGLMRRLSFLRSLQEREHGLAFSQIFTAAKPSHIEQLENWRQANEQAGTRIESGPPGDVRRAGKPASHDPGTGDAGSQAGSGRGRARAGAGPITETDRATFSVPQRHPEPSDADIIEPVKSAGSDDSNGQPSRNAGDGHANTRSADAGLDTGRKGTRSVARDVGEQGEPVDHGSGTDSQSWPTLIQFLSVIARPRLEAKQGLRASRNHEGDLLLIDEYRKPRLRVRPALIEVLEDDDLELGRSIVDDLGQGWTVTGLEGPEPADETPSPFD